MPRLTEVTHTRDLILLTIRHVVLSLLPYDVRQEGGALQVQQGLHSGRQVPDSLLGIQHVVLEQVIAFQDSVADDIAHQVTCTKHHQPLA